MPELPEVETIKRGLSKHIVGRRILNFEKRDQKIIQFEPKEIVGKKILEINRRAKMLVFNISGKKSILAHMKMTGQFIWEPSASSKAHCLRNRVSGGHPTKEMLEKLPVKSTKAIFTFDDKSILCFNDQRRFGYMKLYDTKELNNSKTKELKNIGIEPYSKKFTVKYLEKMAKRFQKRKIKQFITDQGIIAGVGNIYADESLYYAGILPDKSVKNISKEQWKKIRSSIIKALNLGLKYGGASEETYVNAEGKQGTAHLHLNVYRKTGEKCKKCASTIERIVISGRGTHFCPFCQK